MSLTSSILTDTQIDVYRGIYRIVRLTVTLDEEPYDLTGATIYFTAKCRTTDTSNALQLTTTAGGIVIATDPRDGYADIIFSTATTQALVAGTYVYDIVVQTSGGERHLVNGPGTLRVLQGVTWF